MTVIRTRICDGDGCGTDLSVAPNPAAWLDILVWRVETEHEGPMHFCSWRCLRKYAASREQS